jgi:hypothetical protein
VATWDDWLAVGRAIAIGRTEALRIAKTNKPLGSVYNKAMRAWLHDNGLACAFRRSRPWIPSEAGRPYRLKPAKDSDDPGRLPRRALATTCSSGQLAGSSSSF